MFLIVEQHGSTLNTGTLLEFGASEQLHVWTGEYWRLVTPMFLHIGWMHLLWNTYASIGWCMVVERALGGRRFLAMYLLSGVAGACMSVAAHRVVSAGASGALFGVVGATLVLRRRMLPSWSALWADHAGRSTIINIGIWTFIGLTALKMDNFAHLGGFLGGGGAVWVMSMRPKRSLGWAAYGALFATLLLVAVRPWWKPSPADAHDLARYGSFYLAGEGGKPNVARAARFLGRSCAAGDADGCGGLGYMESRGIGLPLDSERGQKRMHEACAGGSDWACKLEAGGETSN